MSERQNQLYLTDILDAGLAIQSYVATVEFDSSSRLDLGRSAEGRVANI